MNTEDLAWKIRRHIIEMTHISNSSHIASALSMVDIIAVLYGSIMKTDAGTPKMETRDRFVLSKGHAGVAVYATLAEMGFFPIENLKMHAANGSKLSAHVSHKGVPGVELSTGSLGHGVSVASGMAMAAKRDNKNHRIFAIIGDGECDEGSVWEMALFANHYRLNNFVVIIDHNKMQSLKNCEDTIELLNLGEKWKTFGWEVYNVDGHSHEELKRVLCAGSHEKPVCIVAHTIKGKGVSFMENNILWHYRAPQGDDYIQAMQELEMKRR